jgi:hypothetical protein
MENGRVQPCGAETLPARARGLLTILEGRPGKPVVAPARTLGQAMRALGVIGRGDFTDLSTNKAHLDDSGNASFAWRKSTPPPASVSGSK